MPATTTTIHLDIAPLRIVLRVRRIGPGERLFRALGIVKGGMKNGDTIAEARREAPVREEPQVEAALRKCVGIIIPLGNQDLDGAVQINLGASTFVPQSVSLIGWPRSQEKARLKNLLPSRLAKRIACFSIG